MSRCALAHDANGVLWPELHHGRCSLAEVGIYLNCCQRSARRMVCAGRFGAMREADGVWLDKGASGKGRGIIRCCPARLWRARGLGRYGVYPGFNPLTHGPRQLFFSTWDQIQAMRQRLINTTSAGSDGADAVRITPDLMGEVARSLASANNEILSLVRRFSPQSIAEFPQRSAAH